LYGSIDYHASSTKFEDSEYKITYNVVDGVRDCNSIKMEKL
jgi:hypothetical protein